MTSKTEQFPLLERATVVRFLPMMDSEGVSLVARGLKSSTQTEGGFLGAFFDRRLDAKATKNQSWRQRRQGFIARNWREGRRLYRDDGSPTRLHLALVAWAYSPDSKGLKRYAKKQGLNNRSISKFVIR